MRQWGDKERDMWRRKFKGKNRTPGKVEMVPWLPVETRLSSIRLEKSQAGLKGTRSEASLEGWWILKGQSFLCVKVL